MLSTAAANSECHFHSMFQETRVKRWVGRSPMRALQLLIYLDPPFRPRGEKSRIAESQVVYSVGMDHGTGEKIVWVGLTATPMRQA